MWAIKARVSDSCCCWMPYNDWQCLYHFTIGEPLDDKRLQTLPAYAHLKKS